MATTARAALKDYFVAGAEPTAVQFAELIDGNLNLHDGGTVEGPVYNSRIIPSLAGMTAVAVATASAITAVANQVSINPFTGAAAHARPVHSRSLDPRGRDRAQRRTSIQGSLL